MAAAKTRLRPNARTLCVVVFITQTESQRPNRSAKFLFLYQVKMPKAKFLLHCCSCCLLKWFSLRLLKVFWQNGQFQGRLWHFSQFVFYKKDFLIEKSVFWCTATEKNCSVLLWSIKLMWNNPVLLKSSSTNTRNSIRRFHLAARVAQHGECEVCFGYAWICLGHV